uniref:Uncharacterized protein LOC105056753 n=1 Tax=Elaeis guineensis var. tenera TaxID=51953 RepID=A0A6I9S494_ELAGV|nr:uncharacterized protein LOC105056753 [Elaeis guineensis]
MHKMLFESDVACVDNYRMDLRSFHKLCMLLAIHSGLKPTKNMEVEELVAMFLHIIAHDERVRNCLGALDGTYIRVKVDVADMIRYRSHKGDIATNVLGICTRTMKFVYVLSRWEGSATDFRVLRHVISKPNRLIIPQGYYYLCDAGYKNAEGFLTPYKGQRIINACALLHNFIRQELSMDLIEVEVAEDVGGTQETELDLGETITYVEMTNA